MVDFERFLPSILTFAPGCAEPAAFDAIREAAIKFCERTRLWNCEDEFDVTASECAGIAVPYGATLYEMDRVDFNGQRLTPKSLAWLDDNYHDWREPRTGNSSASYVTQLEPDTLVIVPAATGRVKVWGKLKPGPEATELPNFMFDKYKRIIADGALGQILLLPGQPFQNAPLAGFFDSRFEANLDKLSGQSAIGQQKAKPRIKPNFI